MKSMFRGYYRPNSDEFTQLWKECTFVFDTNVLLNIYRYTPETSKQFLSILDSVSDRIWLPFQAALEYHKRSIDVVLKQKNSYDEIESILKDTLNGAESKLNSHAKHSVIDVKRIQSQIAICINEIIKDLSEKKARHPNVEYDDVYKDRIATLFDGKVGGGYDDERLKELYSEGNKRYENKVPPGYEDAGKPGLDKYGDLLIWFQIIEYSSTNGKPVIFVTDDNKDDWWYKVKGRTIGPHPLLVEEFYNKTNNVFYMYTADSFMNYSRQYLHLDITDRVIDEVKDVDKQAENKYLRKRINRQLFPTINNYSETLKRITQYQNQIVADAAMEQYRNNIAQVSMSIAELTSPFAILQKQLADACKYSAAISAPNTSEILKAITAMDEVSRQEDRSTDTIGDSQIGQQCDADDSGDGQQL